MKDVTIVGSGAVSAVLSRELARDKKIIRIRCVTLDLTQARRFIPHYKKIRLLRGNASDWHQVAQHSRNTQLIINASLPDFNISIMKAALSVGAHYLDLCSRLRDNKTAEQFTFDRQFKKKQRVALINAGIAPGITNLLAREAADKLDRVHSVRFRLLEDQQAQELIFSWSPYVTLDELTSPPLFFRNRRFILKEPLTDPEEYRFPGTFGKHYVFNIYGDEVATLPRYIRVNEIDYKSGGADITFAKALSRLGLFRKTPVQIHGKRIVPAELFKRIAPEVPDPERMRKMIREGIIKNAYLISVIDVVGIYRHEKVRLSVSVQYPDLRAIQNMMPGATYISYPAGIAAYAFGNIIPSITSYGVMPPEALPPALRKAVLLILEKKGAVITETYRTVE